MKFGMPSKRVLLKALYFLLLAGIILGIGALFIGVITINVNVGGGLDSGPNFANIIGNGSYFKYLEVQKKFNKLYTSLNSISPNTTVDYTYSPLARTTNHIDDEIQMKSGILPIPNPGSSHNASGIIHNASGIIHHNASGIIHNASGIIHNASGILPPSILPTPGPVMPSSGSLAPNNS
jgi:hypothetical protein